MGVEPTMADLQSAALATWLRSHFDGFDDRRVLMDFASPVKMAVSSTHLGNRLRKLTQINFPWRLPQKIAGRSSAQAT